MGYRERAALALFACRVTTMGIALVFASHVMDPTVLSSVLTQFVLSMVLVMRPPINFDNLRKPWAAPLVAYLKLCSADMRADIEAILRSWERKGGAIIFLIVSLLYWRADSYGGFVAGSALANGVVMALLFLRVRYALRDTAS